MTAVVALLVLLTVSASATQRIDQRTWRRVKTYEMADLQKLDPPPVGRIVGVKFNYRHTDIREPHAYWYLGSIWRVVRTSEKADFMHINVMVPEADLEAFKRITTDFQSSRTYIGYGQILYYQGSTFPFLQLFGTKVRHVRHGVVVGW